MHGKAFTNTPRPPDESKHRIAILIHVLSSQHKAPVKIQTLVRRWHAKKRVKLRREEARTETLRVTKLAVAEMERSRSLEQKLKSLNCINNLSHDPSG